MFKIFVVILCLCATAYCCGVTTHQEIGHRAAYFSTLDDKFPALLRSVIEEHQEAFQPGNGFPDWGYALPGHHDESEDAHWTPFINATISWLKMHYTNDDFQTNVHARRLVAYLAGFVSHEVADISWHCLGAPQGFLCVNGDEDFHGSFSDAHSRGDPGGDMVNGYEQNYTTWIEPEWYIPFDDLIGIYGLLGVNDTTLHEGIIEGMGLLHTAALFERSYGYLLYSHFAISNPFLVNELYDYPFGGVNDMALWTRRIWTDVFHALTVGYDGCVFPNNPLYISCSVNTSLHEGANDRSLRSVPPASLKFWEPFIRHCQGVGIVPAFRDAVEIVENVYGGRRAARLSMRNVVDMDRVKAHFLEYLESLDRKRSSPLSAALHSEKRRGEKGKTLSISPIGSGAPYSEFGKDVVTVSISGETYICIGAPGENAFSGSVTITKTDATGSGTSTVTQKLVGTVEGGRFGSSIAVVDWNGDSVMDLVVGSPGYGSSAITYVGSVSLFLGVSGSSGGGWNVSSTPYTVLRGSLFMEAFGTLMTTADIDADGDLDLILSSPFAACYSSDGSADGAQRGNVSVITMPVTEETVDGVTASTCGGQDYEWFGTGVVFSSETSTLYVGSPTLNSPSDASVQSVGSVTALSLPDLMPTILSTGTRELEQLGTATAILSPCPFRSGDSASPCIAMGSPTADTEIDGVHYDQSGIVTVIDADTRSVIGTIEGHQSFSLFGNEMRVCDLDGDGSGDLIVAAPKYNSGSGPVFNDDEVENGALFVWLSGSEKSDSSSTSVLNGNVRASVAAFEKTTDSADVQYVFDRSHSWFGSKIVCGEDGMVLVSAERDSIDHRDGGSVFAVKLT